MPYIIPSWVICFRKHCQWWKQKIMLTPLRTPVLLPSLSPDALVFWTIATSSGWNQLFLHPVWTALVFFLDKWSDRRNEYEKQHLKAACSWLKSRTAKKIQEFLRFAKLFHLFMGFQFHFLFSQSWTSQHDGNMVILVYCSALCLFSRDLFWSKRNWYKGSRKLLSEMEIVFVFYSGMFCSAARARVKQI